MKDFETLMEENMTQKQNKLNSQKYFIFKVNEYFNNTDHTMHNKKSDSFISMLADVLELQEEIFNEKTVNSKLQSSLNNLLEGVCYHCNYNPVLINHIYIQRDIVNLRNKIKEKDKDYLTIFHSISSLFKKIKTPNFFINLHIDLIQSYPNINHFLHVDIILDSFVNELIYQGHSTKYLQEWYKNKIAFYISKDKEFNDNLAEVIELFRTVSNKANKYQVIYNCSLPEDLSDEIKKNKFLTLESIYKLIEFKELSSLIIKGNNEGKVIESFPSPGKFNNFFVQVEINSCDQYKAISEGKKSLEEYLQIYKLLNPSNNFEIHELCLILDNDSSVWNRERTILKSDTGKLNTREKEDVKDLIDIRNNFRLNEIDSQNLKVLERSLEQIDKSGVLTEENRLLNVWSSLEYILSFYTVDSIIGKASNIIPKVISLYYVKGKMNILWDRLIPYQKNSDIAALLYGSQKDDSKKYHKEAFANFLKDTKKATELYNILPTVSIPSIILQRQISELNGLLNNPDSITKRIKQEHDLVKYDLYRIYRVRNKLVHSGNNIPDNMNITTERLSRYVNYLIGTIIFQMKRNPEFTIIEILNSIVVTYSWYTKEDTTSLDIKEYVTVPYL